MTADSQPQNSNSDFEDVDIDNIHPSDGGACWNGSNKPVDHSAVYAPLLGQPDENGKVECIIIPRHIKDAAVRNGLKPLVGCGLGSHAVEHYANSSESEDEEEVEDEMGHNANNRLELADTLGISPAALKRSRRRRRQERRRNAAIAAA